MKDNPFPGMNPWLESHWGDVHTRLTTYSCDQLQPQLPSGLRARIEEYIAVETDPLRADDNDVPLQLQALLEMAYVNGRYCEDINYAEDPLPPMTGADAEWADQRLREKGLR